MAKHHGPILLDTNIILECHRIQGWAALCQLRGDTHWLTSVTPTPVVAAQAPVGGITSEAEEQELEALNAWVEDQGLPRGQLAFDCADFETGGQKAVFDLAWPEGLQPGLTAPVVVLLNETADVLALASGGGFRCFTTVPDFRAHDDAEILEPGAVW